LEAVSSFPIFGPFRRRCWSALEPGPYTISVKVPSGVKLMPHKHPEDRVYTVISGIFYIGLGDKFDGDKVKAYPPGCLCRPQDISTARTSGSQACCCSSAVLL